jgi:hypothetical protein
MLRAGESALAGIVRLPRIVLLSALPGLVLASIAGLHDLRYLQLAALLALGVALVWRLAPPEARRGAPDRRAR